MYFLQQRPIYAKRATLPQSAMPYEPMETIVIQITTPSILEISSGFTLTPCYTEVIISRYSIYLSSLFHSDGTVSDSAFCLKTFLLCT